MKMKTFALLLVMAAIVGSCVQPKTSKNPEAKDAALKAAAAEKKMMIIARISTKPEKTAEFIDAAKQMIEKSNAESGCTFYQLYQDPYDPSNLVFVEEYKNQAAVDAHFATDYFEAFGAEIQDFVAEPADIRVMTIEKEVKK